MLFKRMGWTPRLRSHDRLKNTVDRHLDNEKWSMQGSDRANPLSPEASNGAYKILEFASITKTLIRIPSFELKFLSYD